MSDVSVVVRVVAVSVRAVLSPGDPDAVSYVGGCRGGLDGLLVDFLSSLKACAGRLGFHAAARFQGSGNPKTDIMLFLEQLPNDRLHYMLVRARDGDGLLRLCLPMAVVIQPPADSLQLPECILLHYRWTRGTCCGSLRNLTSPRSWARLDAHQQTWTPRRAAEGKRALLNVLVVYVPS